MNHVDKARSLRPVLVTGSHRSGTTWVGRMLDSSGQTGYIYEPFNPSIPPTGLCVAKFRGFTYIHEDNEPEYANAIAKTLSYSYDIPTALYTLRSMRGIRRRLSEYTRSKRHAKNRLRPLMKDPIAVFSAEWLANKFDMDVLVLIRHPAAFVSSILGLGWTHNFQEFLDQPRLVSDHLSPYRKEIEEYAIGEKSTLEQASLAWKLIHHMIAKYRDRHSDWLFIKHEDISKNPEIEFQRVFNAFDLEFNPAARSTIKLSSLPRNPVNAPGGKGTHLLRNSSAIVDSWRSRLTKEQVSAIRKIVEPTSSLFYDDASW